jgi:hypothetical protein
MQISDALMQVLNPANYDHVKGPLLNIMLRFGDTERRLF